MSTVSAKYTLIEQMKLIVPLDPSSPTFVDDAWLDYATRTTVALLPFTFGSTVSNPIPGEIRFLLVDAVYDPLTGLTTPAGYQMNFWDGTQWVGTGGGGGSSYVLPNASATVLGGIKVGTNLSIDVNGVLSATASAYTLPIASAGTLGGIKVGTGLSIDGSGVLSASGGGGTPGGATTQVQFNDGGAFAGDSSLVWDKTNDTLVLGTATTVDAIRLNTTGARLRLSNTAGNDYFYSYGDYRGISTPGWLQAQTLVSTIGTGNTALFVETGASITWADNSYIVARAGGTNRMDIVTQNAGLKLNTFLTIDANTGTDPAPNPGLNVVNNYVSLKLGGGANALLFGDGTNIKTPGAIIATGGFIGPITLPSGSMTWDPASLAAGDYITQTVTVTGALLGQAAIPSLSVALPAGMMLTAAVTAADTVTVTLWNFSFTAQDLASSTLKVRLAT